MVAIRRGVVVGGFIHLMMGCHYGALPGLRHRFRPLVMIWATSRHARCCKPLRRQRNKQKASQQKSPQ